jgi:quercetin dioxygenase-like cupin family protein
VYVLEGAVVLEVDGMPSQTFKVGQAFAELPNVVHNLRNASATEPAKALGFNTPPKARRFKPTPPTPCPAQRNSVAACTEVLAGRGRQ